eukprot:CAMPEP_0174316478 /NCGR_PEP_ID=MMETSP0810-20121108/6969_1 /TAXON_ID=73025 ORGANISM="Eutreptiella gymnastica-like, Strain CCMP1594" /NCGR_SAMPLE_ID=MMETSP0810 /ASSEMBLY_ACC=CAM_ASM_000659 /LENGTH=80 /DNA_ID=CAMNT_0015426189 /DNA_START=729 /DNA_END=968 /DNA_ORIENTATION=-
MTAAEHVHRILGPVGEHRGSSLDGSQCMGHITGYMRTEDSTAVAFFHVLDTAPADIYADGSSRRWPSPDVTEVPMCGGRW